MRSKTFDWGNCERCGIKITDNNLGGEIESKEVIVCRACFKDHIIKVIQDIEAFRKTDDFNDIFLLRKKILQTSEAFGYLFENASKTSRERVSDYDKYNFFQLQLILVDIELTFVERELIENYNLQEYEQLRLELKELHSKILAYKPEGDFFK